MLTSGNRVEFSRVLVTGATGFLGGVLVRALRRTGHDVVAFGRDATKCAGLAQGGVTTLAHDLAIPLADHELARLGQVDAIVHCAARSSPFGPMRDFERDNVEATRQIVALAQRTRVRRFVHISTPAVYFRFADQFDVTEDMSLPRPVNHYARTKRAAEQMVLEAAAVRPVVLRPRAIYGHGDNALLPRILRAARSGLLPLMRDGVARTDMTHVDDVVAAILAAMRSPQAGGVFNISGGEALPLRQIVEMACERSGIAPRWRRVPVAVAMQAARVAEWAGALTGVEPKATRYGLGVFAYTQTLSLERAARELDWRPGIRFAEGLARTFGGAACD